MRDDARRLVVLERHAAQNLFDLFHIVPINFADHPPKGLPLCREWLQLQNIGYAAKTLNFVIVDDRNKIVETMMTGEQCSLPSRALVTFPVTQQGKNPVFVPVPLSGKRHAA